MGGDVSWNGNTYQYYGLDSEAFKQLDSKLRQLSSHFGSSPDPDNQMLGDAYDNIRGALMDAAARTNPKIKCIILSGHASQFVCPADLRSHVRAVVDKTQAYGTLQKEISEIVHPKAESGQ
ncbi:hypothetical protein EBU91_03050, partial [bacterium]|nr:hypothetical protein [bacterium]